MSGGATRSSSNRRSNRSTASSPYSRPQAKKSSSWSIGSVLSYLNPIKSFLARQEDDDEDLAEAATRLSKRGREIEEHAGSVPQQRRHPPPPPPPQAQEPTTPEPPPSVSTNGPSQSPYREDRSSSAVPAENIKKVQEFLDEKAGRSINHVELAGILHLLQGGGVDDDEPMEPFRFSKSPSVTPARGTTPNPNFTTPGSASQGARKTLSKNPMGVYRLQGGGSARPRNRYQSPGFGSSGPRAPTIKLAPEKPKSDNKRRRVGEEASSSSPQRAGETTPPKQPSTSPSRSTAASTSTPPQMNGTRVNGTTTTNGAPAKPNGAMAPPSTPRLRTNLKPTTPSVPSPLRQSWAQVDSPPQPSPPSKQTRAASFMEGLIKEATPPKKPDFLNPYEAASPIPRPATKKPPPARRTRAAAAKMAAEAKPAKEPELTPQAIIEATVPKGSKRSRPPPEILQKKSSEKRVTSPPSTSAPPPRRSSRLRSVEPEPRPVNGNVKTSPTRPVTAEEVSDDEGSPSKKRRTGTSKPNGRAPPDIVIEEVEDDIEMSAAPVSQSNPSPSVARPAEVVEPREDKNEKTPSPPAPGTSLPGSRPSFGGAATKLTAAPKAPSRLRFSFQAEKEAEEAAQSTSAASSKPTSAPPAKSDKPKDPRAFVAAMREDELPKYTFSLPTSSPGAGPSSLTARNVARAAPVTSLPTYDFTKPATNAASSSRGFDWAAAGAKPPPKPAAATWTCGICLCSSPADAEKCVVCEAPNPDKKPKPAATAGGFNWAAAGMKPPAKPAGTAWTCGTCMCSSPADASKCVVCDTPR